MKVELTNGYFKDPQDANAKLIELLEKVIAHHKQNPIKAAFDLGFIARLLALVVLQCESEPIDLETVDRYSWDNHPMSYFDSAYFGDIVDGKIFAALGIDEDEFTASIEALRRKESEIARKCFDAAYTQISQLETGKEALAQ